VTYALTRDVFPTKYVNTSITFAANDVGVLSIVGPFLAGALIDNFSVSAIFWFVGLLTVVGMVGTLLLVPETPIRTAGDIDWVGVALLVVGLLPPCMGLGNSRHGVSATSGPSAP